MSERYEILGKVARGGIGAIYRATDTVMGREVALKRLLPIEETHLNEAAGESLEREAAALARFQHPNVVTIYAFESDEEGSYVVMELVEGENLKETIERGALPLDDFETLVLQTLDPLIAAKDMNLLHRDIKPSNIMLTWLSKHRFQVKVLDFGLAKFSQTPSTQTLDQTGSFLGSIDYLAPEQLELAPLDQRTDLYSLGCVLYYCLTQQPPFAGKNSAETIQNHLKHKVTPLRELRSDVSPAIADWVMRMISRYPNQRPEDSRAALREFEAALSGVSHAPEPDEPVVEVVEEIPIARAAAPDAEAIAGEATTTVSRPALVKTAPQVAARPKLNVAPVPQKKKPLSTSAPSRARKKAATRPNPPAKKRPEQVSDPKRRIIILACAIAGAALVLFLLFGNGDDDGDPPNQGKGISSAKGGGEANPSTPPAKPLPPISNPSQAPETPPPPVTEGLIAHFKAGEQCWGGNDLQTVVNPGKRIMAWGNLAAGAATDHLLTVDPGHRDKGPQLRTLGPKVRPELNQGHPVLSFRNIDRLITQESSDIEKQFAGARWTEWTVMLVIRTESFGGQFFRFIGTPPASRILKLEITGKGARYKSTMTRGTTPQRLETALGKGKGKFLIFSHIWSGKEFGEQRHHFLLPDKQRIASKPGEAPHRKMPQYPKRYALGATDAATAVNDGVDEDRNPKKEGTGGFKGDIAELLIYRRILDDKERKEVEDYLHARYFAKKG